MDEIGERMGYTGSRVAQIHNSLLRKLRDEWE